MNGGSTHFLFNEKGIFISPDIQPVFQFLMDIEKEIDSLLGFNEKIDSIRQSHLEMINFVGFLSNKLKGANIDFNYTFKEHPEKIAEKLKLHLPLRSQIIVLFASLEVLFNLHASYELETNDEKKLRETTMDSDTTKKFINEFLLTNDNQYYLANHQHLSKIDSAKMRDLRNSLTHFFSIGHGGLSLSPSLLSQKARKLENILKQNKKGNVVFISENDLYNLIKQANILRMKRWSDDFQKNPQDFKRKIQHVINLVKREGAIIVQNNQINI